jgi:hypothetical protein
MLFSFELELKYSFLPTKNLGENTFLFSDKTLTYKAGYAVYTYKIKTVCLHERKVRT